MRIRGFLAGVAMKRIKSIQSESGMRRLIAVAVAGLLLSAGSSSLLTAEASKTCSTQDPGCFGQALFKNTENDTMCCTILRKRLANHYFCLHKGESLVVAHDIESGDRYCCARSSIPPNCVNPQYFIVERVR